MILSDALNLPAS